ncbi:MAG: Uma2 family endonuclease [Cyanobacteria bacterium J06639_1]
MTATIPERSLPALENGDRLTRTEFEQRCEAMPALKKAELIEGTVFMAAALRANSHGNPHALMMTWLGAYFAATPGTYVADNATVRLDLDNEAQPDALLRIEPEAGGQSRITEDDYIEGAPELIIEIAASSAAYDMNAKLHVYRRHGVREYIVWQMYENHILWHRLREGTYDRVAPDDKGRIESQEFPGLVLDVNAMQQKDLSTVLARLQLGTSAHQAFVQRLSSPA